MLTALTHVLLRGTLKRWFADEPDIVRLRARIDGLMRRTDPFPGACTRTELPPAGQCRLIEIAPRRPAPDAGAPLLLYFHGGGYIVGGMTTHGAFCARLARMIGGRVLFADYRLAPEHPFPAAAEDGIAAYRAAVSRAAGPLFVAGDSAGGGLALATVQAAIAEGLPMPSRLVLISPWLDLTLSAASMIANAKSDSMLSMKILARMRGAYLGEQDPADRRASPLFDTNTHLPPALLVYSESEVLAGDSVRLAERLRRGGTEIRTVSMRGKPHVFPLLRTVPGAGAALRHIGAFLAGG